VIAASIAVIWPQDVPGELADSMATIVVSVIILIALVPLLHRLYATSRRIVALSTDPKKPIW